MIKKRRKLKVKTLLRLMLLILCGGIIGYNLYCANAGGLVGNKLPMPFGYGAAVVLSGSMEPALSKGDLILVKAGTSLEVGDVVVYQEGSSLVVHRVVQRTEDTVTTRGDANNVEDAPVPLASVKGEVVGSAPYLGSAVEWMKTPLGTLAVVAVVLLMELSRVREKRKDDEELEKIKQEIRALKGERKE